MMTVRCACEDLPGPAVSIVDLHIKTVRICEEEVFKVLKGGQDEIGYYLRG